MSETRRYTKTAVILHWLMAMIIIGLWLSGLIIDDLPKSPLRIAAISWHKWIGLTIITLWTIRVLWKIKHPAPPLEKPMPAPLHQLMKWTHLSLYMLMVLVPICGWLMSSAKGYTVNFFGLFELPDLVSQDKELGHLLKELHELGAHSLLFLVGIHVLAVIKHQWIDKDRILSRMRLK